MLKRVLIAPNAFKHSLSAIEVAKTIKSTLDSLNLGFTCEVAPIADGGDGTLEVINFYFKKSEFIECRVHDPLMREIESKWLLLDKETAVIELAKASGISLLKESELNPLWANTIGTGELILSALNNGCKKIIVALGGSATVDAGLGILAALGAKVLDKKKNHLKIGGGFLNLVETIDLGRVDKRIKDIELQLLCDVKIPLCGEKGTVQKFAAQKGAKEGEIIILEKGLKHFSEVVKKLTTYDYESEPMVGSAGGVAFSLKALLNAEMFGGFSYLSRLVSLEEKIKNADLIITGEGNLDSQTLFGKGVFELSRLADKYAKKVIVFCGDFDKTIDWSKYNMDFVFQIKPEALSLSESLKEAKDLIKCAVKENCELLVKIL